MSAVETATDNNPNTASVHEENVACLCAGENGIATESVVYSASSEQYLYHGAIEQLLAHGAFLINSSAGPEGVNENYSLYELYVDYLVNVHKVIFVQAAGNEIEKDVYIVCPGLADNVITVGGYNNNFSESYQDDQMYGFVFDENGGCKKPDIVAPANTPLNDYGTSYAAPFVTGCIALMLELKPNLATQPEVVKAIILASCHRKANPFSDDEDPELITQGITDKQGAGVFDPFVALSIVSHGTYGTISYPANYPAITLSFIQPYYDSNLNISIAWIRQNTRAHFDAAIAVPREDYNIELYQNSTKIGGSALHTSSTEMIYLTRNSSSNSCYTLRIKKMAGNNENTPIGYAWSVDKTRNQYAKNNIGFFLLKNPTTGYYLQTNSANNSVTQNTLSGNLSQTWLMRRGPSVAMVVWAIQNAADDQGYFSCSSASGDNYLVSTNATGSLMMRIFNADNTTSYFYPINNSWYILGVPGSGSNTSAVWMPFSGDVNNIQNNQKWESTVCAYQRGDINLDGSFSSDEARLILRYSTGLEDFTEVQKYLADINGDGVINSEDSRLASRYAVGLFDD